MKDVDHERPVGSPHQWHEITDLPGEWRHWENRDLDVLKAVWHMRKDALDPAEIREFLARLNREWAVETGRVEGLYHLSAGMTAALIAQGLFLLDADHTASAAEHAGTKELIEDQQSVLEGLFDFVGGGRELTTSYIKEMHHAFTRHQDFAAGIDPLGRKVKIPLRKGAWKEFPNNPTRPDGSIHEYCPPEQVGSEMERLLSWHREHAAAGVHPVAEAAWLHHRFVQIHPFQDGNGRVARALAALVLIKAGMLPLSVRLESRKAYLDALETADAGDFARLVDLFTHLERGQLMATLAVGAGMRPRKSAAPTAAALPGLGDTDDMIAARLAVAAQALRQALPAGEGRATVTSDGTDGAALKKAWYTAQALDCAERRGYALRPNGDSSWRRLKVEAPGIGTDAAVVFATHKLNCGVDGVYSVQAFFEARQPSERGIILERPVPLDTYPLIFIAGESAAEDGGRLNAWMLECLGRGLDKVRDRLMLEGLDVGGVMTETRDGFAIITAPKPTAPAAAKKNRVGPAY